ncbi:MAG: ABC transporter permease [Planctomycetota bacterium]
MIFRPLSPSRRIGLGIFGVLALVGFYALVAELQRRANADNLTVPTLHGLWQGVERMLEPHVPDGRWIVVDAQASFYRLFCGLAAGIVASVIVGLFMGCYSVVEAVLVPPLSLLAKVPPTAMMAVFFVLFGIDLQMYISMIAFGVFPTLTQSVYLAARSDVPEELIHKAQTLGASQFEIIWNVVLRQILPKVLDAVRLQVGPAMVYLIAAEYMVASLGFGYRIRMQSRLSDMRVVYVYLTLLGFAGLFFDMALTWLRRWLCPWAR